MNDAGSHPPAWHPDPSGRNEQRYWDGTSWTEHVANRGETGVDPMAVATPPAPSALDRVDSGLTIGNEGSKVQEQLTGTGYRGVGLSGPVAGGGGSLLNEPILVVNQKAKLIELNNEYSVFDQNGTKIAAVTQVGQSAFRKLLRLFFSFDQFLTHRLAVVDAAGSVQLKLTRPGKIFKSKVIVEDGNGNELGRIIQKNMIGKINFDLESGGQTLGAIKAENWRAWNFRIEDTSGTEIARVTKTWEGLAKTMFTTADNYVVQISQRPPEPLNSLVVASALSIDTALKQDNRGFG
ncbi:MAG: phospholipid scramblase-related protein [Acidimicrobiales bacterium]